MAATKGVDTFFKTDLNPFFARKNRIYLNPLRAGLVPDLKQLSGFVYCGHSRIMGTVKSDWQDVDKVLEMLDAHRKSARRVCSMNSTSASG